jgi:carbon monoxide dehydrogenase subunit G
MAIRIDERFQVDAPIGAVWDFLVDPRRVVACVPGGELLGVTGDGAFDGRLRVAIGPFTFAYGGRVRIAEEDLASRHVRIVGEARERAGSDSARLTLVSRLATLPGGATEVVAHARVEVEGRLVELGRGLLEPLGHLVFQDFAGAVRAAVEAEAAGAAPVPATGARPRAPAGPPLRAVPLAFRTLGSWMAAWLRHRAR